MCCADIHFRIPPKEGIGEVCRFMSGGDVSDLTLSIYGFGSLKQLAFIRSRINALGLSARQIESFDRETLWEVIFQKN